MSSFKPTGVQSGVVDSSKDGFEVLKVFLHQICALAFQALAFLVVRLTEIEIDWTRRTSGPLGPPTTCPK